ncbi:hypothetical protein ABT095_29220 [Kitasatospora sp. NPDC002227]|uniref:RCC1 domain-containing protein n=1 Tax=Kitasatospora sp. NPDC002227 TaxID=3154773 RepID=UPI003327053F
MPGLLTPDHRPGPPRPPSPRAARALVLALLAALLGALGVGPGQAAAGQGARALRPGVAGTAVGWGKGNNGQLGDGTTIAFRTTPDRACGSAPCTGPLQNVISISSGGLHTLALRADGTVVGWGLNASGQLGNGTYTDQATPTPVCAPGQSAPCSAFLSDVVAVSAGYSYSLALRADGTVLAWGSNTEGQLGDGTTSGRNTPVTTCQYTCDSPLANVVAVSAGGGSLALLSSGLVFSWGANERGELGNGTTANSLTANPVCGDQTCTSSLAGITAITAGGGRSMALRSDSHVVAWGLNAEGELGDGTTTDRLAPVLVCAVGESAPCTQGLSGVAALGTGTLSAAVTTTGAVRTWGDNFIGELGDGTTTNRLTPVAVCAVGESAPCAQGLTGVTAVTSGTGHGVALRSDGSVVGWGWNTSGQVGDGTTTQRNSPVRVCAAGQSAPCGRFLEGVTAIGGGTEFTTAVVRPQADLAVSITASPEPVVNAANLTYTVAVRNSGPTSAEGVAVSDTVPANGRFVSATVSKGSCVTPPVGSTDSVKCTVGLLDSGATATVTLVVRPVTTGGGSITDTARATATTPDPDLDNNTATITTPLR